MGESLTMRRCVEDEGPRAVNSCHGGKDGAGEHPAPRMVPQEEGAANSVPAAAVIQRPRALFGFTGRKACVGCQACRT